MRKLLLSLCLSGTSCAALGQIALSYYPVTSYIGVSTNTARKCWADLRLLTNTFIGFSNIEISPKLNLKNTEAVKIYAGAGFNLNVAQGAYDGKYINGYFLSGGIMASPFKEVRSMVFIFEISPYVNYRISDGMIRTTLGIAWQFKKKKKADIK